MAVLAEQRRAGGGFSRIWEGGWDLLGTTSCPAGTPAQKHRLQEECCQRRTGPKAIGGKDLGETYLCLEVERKDCLIMGLLALCITSFVKCLFK